MKKIALLLLLLVVQSIFSQNNLQTKPLITTVQTRQTENYNPLTDIVYWFFSEITYGILFETYWERNTPMHHAALTPYPYFDKNEGNYTYQNESVPFRLEISGNIAFDQQQYFFGHWQAQLRLAKRLDFTGSFVHLPQRIPDNRYFLSQTGFVLNYHRIRTKKFDLWYGIGIMFSEAPNNTGGFVYDIGTELFFGNQISVDGLIKWSYFEPVTIRNSQFNINYFSGHWRFQTGINNYKLVSQYRNSLHIGIKYYF